MRIAFYARVSTQRQAQADGIAQQLDRLRGRAQAQGWLVADEDIFRDDGYSGANLKRPGLERLRDRLALRVLDRVLITAPDRLARHCVHQVLLLEEITATGCQVEFLDWPMSQDPHDQLLLQIRGAVAEYERSPGDFRCAKTPRLPSACAGGVCASCRPAPCCPGQGRPMAFALIPSGRAIRPGCARMRPRLPSLPPCSPCMPKSDAACLASPASCSATRSCRRAPGGAGT